MRPLAVVIVLLAGLAAAPLGAQSDTTAADTAFPLAPIRVTVLRTPLQLAETPYAVTVERPAGTGPGLTLAEALGTVPGLQVDNRYNFSQGDRISVRGLGARAQFGVRGVKVLVDGVPATLPDGQTSLSHVDPRWIERAEVVRGPASSLWGNASGGVLQLGTGDPPVAGLDASASVTGGSHGLTRYAGRAGWGSGLEADGSTEPAVAPGLGTPRLGFRASASRLLYDGFREHASADKRFLSARADWRQG
ncbi:MAG: TonB-dependent receptor plug domain-containing protein, partial [Longimicrobiales bacterium]|nr:TonB-dependent receptor plug domain-containing protein [Longimicrobiales bacterium]